jgi:hypothetical protein
MFRTGLLVHSAACGKDRSIGAAMPLRRTDKLQIAMLVRVVVPTLKKQRPRTRVVHTLERPRVVGSILEGSEETFRKRIVVAHTGAAVGGIDAELLQFRHERRCLHRAAVVLVND